MNDMNKKNKPIYCFINFQSYIICVETTDYQDLRYVIIQRLSCYHQKIKVQHNDFQLYDFETNELIGSRSSFQNKYRWYLTSNIAVDFMCMTLKLNYSNSFFKRKTCNRYYEVFGKGKNQIILYFKGRHLVIRSEYAYSNKQITRLVQLIQNDKSKTAFTRVGNYVFCCGEFKRYYRPENPINMRFVVTFHNNIVFKNFKKKYFSQSK